MTIRLLTGLLLALGFTQSVWAEDWSAGAARVNITPSEPTWMGGYASRTRPAEGKLTNLWAKALVFSDGQGTRAILITADLVGIDREFSLSVRNAIAAKHGLPIRSIALNVSHTHSGPVVSDVLAPQQRLDEQQRETVKRYASKLQKMLIAVADEALENLAPCQLSWGIGRCGFAVNRRENKEAEVPTLIEKGKLTGPVDHTVPVLKVSRASNETLAVVFGYACHATVTRLYEWSGDYPGFAQMAIEKSHPDTVAMFCAGCGADQNPLPRRSVELARSYGAQLASAVEEVLQTGMKPIRGQLSTAYREIPLAFGESPPLEEIRSTLNSKTPKYVNWANLMLARRQNSEESPDHYPYPVQLWRLGNGPMLVFLGGEVVVDYSLRLKAELDPDRTWVAGYSNDVMNYIPSRRVYLEGGYEGLTSFYTYGLHAPWTPQVEQTIVAAVHELADQTTEQ